MQKILILTFANLNKYPRAIRQINILKGKYIIHTVGLVSSGMEDKYYKVEKPSGINKFIKLVLLKLCYFEKYYWDEKKIKIKDQLVKEKYDLIIAHSYKSLPLACKIANQKKIIFDEHEYALEEYNERFLWRFFFKKYIKYILDKYIPKINLIITVSQGIADKYIEEFGVRPIVITNAAEYCELYPKKVSGKIRLIHHGSASPGRKLELMIEMMNYLNDNYQLDLILIKENGFKSYYKKIKQLSEKYKCIRILEPVPFNNVEKFCNDYDIGVFLLPPTNYSLQYALPNKFFQYIQSRLCVAVGPSPEMAKYINKYNLGIVSNDFTPKSLAHSIMKLSKADINLYKNNSHESAFELSSAIQAKITIDIISKNTFGALIVKSVLSQAALCFSDLCGHNTIHSYMKLINEMNEWTPEKISEWQNTQFLNMFYNAYEKYPAYRKYIARNGIQLNDISSINDLSKLPLVNKHWFIENYNELITYQNKPKYKYDGTGGSTGNPMKFLISLDSLSFLTAFNIICWQKLGYSYGEKYIALGSSSLFPNSRASIKYKLYNIIRGRIPLNGVNMSDEVIKKYLNNIQREKIKYLYGYASALFLLGKYVLDNKIKIKNVDLCMPTSEILTDIYRETLEEAFRCKVMDCYGARDGGINAYEVFPKKYFVSYNCIVELRDPDSSGMGKIIVTDVLNHAFPFIRYELGDEVILDKNPTSYYNGQILNKIIGRTGDVLRLENGRVLTGPGFTILFKNLNVEMYRIKKIDSLVIECSLKINNSFKKQEEQIIIDTIKKQAGIECDVLIKYVDSFALSQSGKKNYYISN